MFGETLKDLRKDAGLVLREVTAVTGIDQGLISKFESGKRKPTESQLEILALAYTTSYVELRKKWLVHKITELLQYEMASSEIMMAAESRIAFLRSSDVLTPLDIDADLRDKLQRIDRLKKLWAQQRPQQGVQLFKMKEFFRVAYTFESNRIEGNTLSLQETKMVIEEGVTIGGKSVVEHLEAINHSDAIGYLEELATDKSGISRRSVMDLHRLILKGIDDANAGVLRSVAVRISGSEHEPPQPYLLAKMMEDYFRYFATYKSTLHPVLMAAEMHERLVTIHPFIDGNGRTSRLVMNLILLQHGYTIANLKGDNGSRLSYYSALEQVQVKDNHSVFHHLVADAVEESLKAHLALV